MKKFIALVFVLTYSTIYSQSKKEQIQSLNFKIDSLNNVIKNNNLSFNEEVNNLKKENLQLSNAISKDKITFEEKISSVNDSLSLLKNINKNLNGKISKQKDLIELFNDVFTIENRDFDVYKDSKLFSQLCFINYLYYGNIKISKSFSTNRSGIVYGNRFIHSFISDSDKLIFDTEVKKYLKYYYENFSTNPPQYLNFSENIYTNVYDITYSELMDSKIAFEPHKIENMSDYYTYLRKNDIENILDSIKRQPINDKLNLNFK